VLQVAL